MLSRRVLAQVSPSSLKRENTAYFKNSDLTLLLKRESHSINSPKMPFLAQARQLSLRRESSSIAQDFTLPVPRGFAPDAANEWIQSLERIFRAMGYGDVQKVTYASYMLANEVENWKKEMEFLRLEQGDMSVGPKLKRMFRHQEIADFATLVNKCMMYEDDLRANEVATPKSISPRNYGPQRNHIQRRGKERVEDDRKPYATPNGHRDRNFQGSRPPIVPTGGFSTPMCNKCGKLHFGSTCPRSGNGCFHYKELEHIKRFCSKLDWRLNVIHAERARDHGRVVTPSGAATSCVDDPVKGNCMMAGIPL
ncbi:hypothetical protein Lal_00046392 [Lupinus albus]|nr:hypothetical protein Lal_00046392 [Lupinus albus]